MASKEVIFVNVVRKIKLCIYTSMNTYLLDVHLCAFYMSTICSNLVNLRVTTHRQLPKHYCTVSLLYWKQTARLTNLAAFAYFLTVDGEALLAEFLKFLSLLL